MKQYKYLVVSGCSQTAGQDCPPSKIWPKLLADSLGLQLINLAATGSGWYHIETSITSFIINNKDIINECFFILQKSELARRPNYEELAICRTDVWQSYNINCLSPIAISSHGYKNWDNFGMSHLKPKNTTKHKQNSVDDPQELPMFGDINDFINKDFHFFPEHKHYPNSRHKWKLGINHDIMPPYIYEQFQELMNHWAIRISSFHLFLKSLDIDHIIVDGYSPFLSYKLNFKNYYDTPDEYNMVNKFWSTETDDPEDEMVYDFKNIKSGWVFDNIDNKYKINDVVLWSLYQFKDDLDWNVDGGHAGPKGMKLIKSVILKNLIEKNWF